MVPPRIEQTTIYHILTSGKWSEERLQSDGIPFIRTNLLGNVGEGDEVAIDLNGIEATSLYILGGLNSVDFAHPGWGGADVFRNFFLGDSAGDLRLEYVDGTVDEIPLVFGYTVWWRHNFRISPEPFASDANARSILDRALCVANGIELLEGDKPLYLRVALRGQPLERIVLHDNLARVGHFVMEGLTFGASDDNSSPPEGFVSFPADHSIDPSRERWLEQHTIIPHQDPFPSDRVAAIEELSRMLYVSEDDITVERVLSTPVDWSADNFEGPAVSFSGSPEALILERVYFENAAGLASRVDPKSGMVNESAWKADRFDGFGGWTPDLGLYYYDAYTRFRGLHVLTQLGFSDNVEAAIEFFDRWMMYFPDFYPLLQHGGKPVPGHAVKIANKPHIYHDFLRHHGWPSNFETRDFGNPENDGHGLLMLGRFQAWTKAGRQPQWVRDRWEAIVEAAEYIPWSLDNPELSLSEHGLLYSETEGGMAGFNSYVDVICYLGLLGYAEMAEGISEYEKAKRWRAQAQRLLDAIEAFYPTEMDGYGKIWNPYNQAGGFENGVLASLFVGMDYWGFNVAELMPDHWKERAENTFLYRKGKNHIDGISSVGIGYGQNYYTQSALLLDRFDDAELGLDWLARACFSPDLQHPFRVPEGFTVREGGDMWRRWADLGNLYQLVETVYTIQLMKGIDDLRPEELLLMPRFPRSWDQASVSSQPIRTNSGGENAALEIHTHWKRSGPASISYSFESSGPIDNVRLRIGPLDTGGVGEITLVVDGEEQRTATTRKGDTEWVWIQRESVSSLIIQTRL